MMESDGSSGSAPRASVRRGGSMVTELGCPHRLQPSGLSPVVMATALDLFELQANLLATVLEFLG